MLELKQIKKVYKIGEIETCALDGISVAFRQKEFVAILGASGSGKTTCLNIIGGLDRYDSGEMTIKGKNTKNFKDRDWDAYRNNSIGFVFQSYNLITHLSIVENVELSMTLSGVSAAEKHKKSLEVLRRVGLGDHLHKRPNQLSGGQMQRVAIARALVNDPEILLCDEPTGALDTATSVQIMNLIKEISNDRLVIMVTHNPELAELYADRTIQFQDGLIVSDTNPHIERPKADEFKLKKTSMSFFTALKLSFNNIRTKKGRTFLTAFASSIGIIGIAVIMSLSTGLKLQINKFEGDAMSEFPITIMPSAVGEIQHNESAKKYEEYPDTDSVLLYDKEASLPMHINLITEDYVDYVSNIDPDICSNIGFTRIVSMNMVRKTDDGKVIPAIIASGVQDMTSGSMTGMSGMTSMSVLSSYPVQINKEGESLLQKQYDTLAGALPQSDTDLILVVDTKNRVDFNVLKALGYETDNVDSIKFDDIIGTEFKLVSNNEYYENVNGMFMPSSNYENMYASESSKTLKIVGVVRPKDQVSLLAPGLAYSDALSQLVIDDAKNSDIVKAQLVSENNVMTGTTLTVTEKAMFLSKLGGNSTPYAVLVYPNSFSDKAAVKEYLDKFNNDKAQADKIIYTDLTDTISGMLGGILDGVTYVLIAFAGISLVVSIIMICIITYTSVIERTKEIGILKALGARKKDISRVFDAETFILGVFSGALGIAIAYLLTIPINAIISHITELTNVSSLNPLHAFVLIVISTALTVLGGHIPARIASKKDAVEALRTE